MPSSQHFLLGELADLELLSDNKCDTYAIIACFFTFIIINECSISNSYTHLIVILKRNILQTRRLVR